MVIGMADKKRNIKRSNIIGLFLAIVLLVLVNIIGSFLFTRFDLTSEKRYSISDETKEMLRNIDDYVFFKVYLEGDFPAGFKRLRNSTREMLDEFRVYSDFVQYEFVNPSESDDANERNEIYQLLVEKGLKPTDLQVKTNEGRSQKIIFPGALVSYGSKEIPVELLRTQIGIGSEQQLNNSIQSLEYNLANAIHQLSRERKPNIAFVYGHGELGVNETADILNTLSQNFNVTRIEIGQKLNSLSERIAVDGINEKIVNKYDALVIAKPEQPFADQDKFIIDQYVMRGGKILWLIDPVLASMDSIQNNESTVGVVQDLNLDDMLFTYGVRLNNDLVMDLNAVPIPLNVGTVGGQAQIEFFPWYYFPMLNPQSKHPVVNNLNAIRTEFVSSMDTFRTAGIRKEILLQSSPYSRTIKAPAFITLRVLQEQPDESKYRGTPKPVAVLLEGKFESVYKNRIPLKIAQNKNIDFKENGKEAKMIVVADGDIIKNQMHIPNGYPLPLGFDQFTGQTFGNKEFILNAIDYLVDNSGLISNRTRELKLRLLDKSKINKNQMWVQIINVLLPILIILIFGFVGNYLRKRKYSRNW
jgi:gliding motility-associatede transport system auxiliary component